MGAPNFWVIISPGSWQPPAHNSHQSVWHLLLLFLIGIVSFFSLSPSPFESHPFLVRLPSPFFTSHSSESGPKYRTITNPCILRLLAHRCFLFLLPCHSTRVCCSHSSFMPFLWSLATCSFFSLYTITTVSLSLLAGRIFHEFEDIMNSHLLGIVWGGQRLLNEKIY